MVRYTPASNAERKKIAPRAYMLLPGTIEIPDQPHEGWRVVLGIDFDGDRVSPTSVFVDSGGKEVAGADLRSLAINDLLSGALLVESIRDGEFLTVDRNWPLKPSEDDQRRMAEQGPTTENVRYAAELYQFAQALRIPANEYVRDVLGISRPTLARWVRKAREIGLIDGDD